MTGHLPAAKGQIMKSYNGSLSQGLTFWQLQVPSLRSRPLLLTHIDFGLAGFYVPAEFSTVAGVTSPAPPFLPAFVVTANEILMRRPGPSLFHLFSLFIFFPNLSLCLSLCVTLLLLICVHSLCPSVTAVTPLSSLASTRDRHQVLTDFQNVDNHNLHSVFFFYCIVQLEYNRWILPIHTRPYICLQWWFHSGDSTHTGFHRNSSVHQQGGWSGCLDKKKERKEQQDKRMGEIP